MKNGDKGFQVSKSSIDALELVQKSQGKFCRVEFLRHCKTYHEFINVVGSFTCKPEVVNNVF